MTTIDKAALRKLAEEATKGPWSHDGVDVFTITDSGQGYPLDRYSDSVDVVIGKCPDCGSRMVGVVHIADEQFIAAARSAVPELLNALDAAEAEFEEVTSSPSPRGQEAEELRAGIEALLKDEPGGDIESNREWRAALLMLLDSVDARDSLSHLVAKDEIEKLRTRRDELLATIARISQSTPLESEVAEALEQRGKLLAEIGTLRAQVFELEQSNEGIKLANDDVHKLWEQAKADCGAMRPIVEAAKAWRESDQIVRSYQESCPLCQDAPVTCDAHMQYADFERDCARRLEAAIDGVAPPAPVDDESRCAVCQWPLAETLEKGCVRGNCSMRPLPENYYAPERAARERADVIRGVPVEQRGKEQS